MKYAFTPLNFSELASQYGKLGGYSYLKTIVDNLRNEADGKALLLDGGDTWQGSGLSLFTNGEDMVESSNILGVDVMTGHWEFTYGQSQFIKNLKKFKGEFVAHNISLTEEAQFDGEEAYDDFGHFQKPYTIKKISNHRIAIIGQAFPYTPIANPGRFVNNLTFGIRENELQELVNRINQNDKPDIIHTIGLRSFQSIVAWMVSKKLNIPLVISDQGGLTTHPFLDESGFLLDELSYPDQILVPANGTAQAKGSKMIDPVSKANRITHTSAGAKASAW